jgi:hypothetical protein
MSKFDLMIEEGEENYYEEGDEELKAAAEMSWVAKEKKKKDSIGWMGMQKVEEIE